MRLKAITANLYVGNQQIRKDLQLLANQGAHTVGIGEGYAFIDELQQVGGYDLIHASPHTRGAQDVPILLKDSIKQLDHGSVQASSPSTPIQIAPARWITWVEFMKRDQKWVHFNTHTNAALQDHDTGRAMVELARVQEAQKHMMKLEAMIKARQADGYQVLVTGDFNYRAFNDPGFKLWKWSPQLVFRRCSMNFSNEGLDYIGYSQGWARDKFTEIGTDKTGSDHPWLVLTLKRKATP